ncbi:MAG: hypothetical protein JEZ05_01130 [Tenericutes bacterium]|nr:hypothetical protein [Mycoplasmatota bacterium]
MKKGKMILSLFVTVMALFMFVSCTENSSLMDSLIRASNDFKAISYSYDSSDSESINNIELTSLSNTEYYVVELSDEGVSDIIQFNQKRLELIAIHQEILIEVENIQVLVASIKDKAQLIKDSEFVLLEDDLASVQTKIETIVLYREGLLETRGLAYQRINDFRGSYTRENLPEVLVMFDEVYEVLEYRLATLRLGVTEFQNIEEILSDYMES